MVEVHLRNGEILKISNDYSAISKFIIDSKDEAMVLTHHSLPDKQFLVRKNAIDYIENKLIKE